MLMGSIRSSGGFSSPRAASMLEMTTAKLLM
jgi:hypothetical protein